MDSTNNCYTIFKKKGIQDIKNAMICVPIYRLYTAQLQDMLCFFVCLEFFVPLENFSLILRRHHCRWRAANLILTYELMTIEQWGFFSVPHLLWHWHPFIMVISEDPWHSLLMPSVWQLSCHYLFLRLRSFAAGIPTPHLPLAGQRLQPTTPPPRRYVQLI